jgi:hypothetical protein
MSSPTSEAFFLLFIHYTVNNINCKFAISWWGTFIANPQSIPLVVAEESTVDTRVPNGILLRTSFAK